MDEPSKQAIETARSWLNAFGVAMNAEAVPEETRRRVMNRLLYGHPDGDHLATVTSAEQGG